MKIKTIILSFLWCFFASIRLYAFENTGSSLLGGLRVSVYTYPSISRHEQRFWNNTRFLYEKSPKPTGAGDLECVTDAVRTLPYNMNYYKYYVKSDTKIITNLKNYPDNVGIVLFNQRLTDEASLLPSEGYISPKLFLASLIKKMCPQILVQTSYNNVTDKPKKNYLDYVLFQYQK